MDKKNDWTLTGNAGTDPATNFLGTTDNEPLVIRTNGAEGLRIDPAGNVGIRTQNPTQSLQVTGQGFFTSSPASPDPGDGSGSGIRIGYQSTDDYGYINANTTGVAAKRLILQQNGGNVGIGTTDAGATLEVRGGAYGITSRGSDIGIYTQNITTPANAVYLATRGLAGDFYGDVYLHGNITVAGLFEGDVTVAGDVILTGNDCAEEFDIAEAAENEPGTVVVLDQDGVLHQSHQAYDKRVAGVISGAGDYRPGLILDRRQSQDSRVPVALVGKVYCKVDAQYAPIEVGDLLTTSPTPGHAMKADDPLKAFGSVIGKALRPLKAGREMIPILIALQ